MIRKVTKKWLGRHNACESSLDYAIENDYIGLPPIDLIERLIKNDRLLDANWLIVRVMSKKQCVKYAVFPAEMVISLFHQKHLDENRPRLAIEAAKDYIKNPCKKTKAAAYAAYAAAYTAHAAYADDAAAYAANVAAYAAAYEADYDSAMIKILRNGIKILKGGKNEL